MNLDGFPPREPSPLPMPAADGELVLMVFDGGGTLIIEHPWPAPGVRYVGNGKPCKTGLSITDALTYEVTPMS